MKRLLVLSVLGAVAFAACSSSAEAQLFRRFRRSSNNNYFNNRANTVPSYQTGANQPTVAAPGAPGTPTLAPAPPAAPGQTVAPTRTIAPRTTTLAPGMTNPGVVGVSPNGPVVGRVRGEAGDPRVLGDGADAAHRAESAVRGAGVRPAQSKANEGTTVIDQP